MARTELIATTEFGDGLTVDLIRDGAHYRVRTNGQTLMASDLHGSEETMAELACAGIARQSGARVLIGGLGMGFTLRAALDVLPADAAVTVVELIPEVVDWNRDLLADLAGRPLDDPRSEILIGDLIGHLRARPAPYDAILLDVDNGPEAFTVPENDWLYGADGLQALYAALRPAGQLALWSAFDDPRFLRRLAAAGFEARGIRQRGRGRVRKGPRHTVFLGSVR